MGAIRRAVRAFGRFWFDFLFGDSVALLPGTLVVLAVGAALHHDRVAAIVTVPALVVLLLLVASYMGRSRPTGGGRPGG